MRSTLYLVPFDFSEISDNALRMALDMAIFNKGQVMILHIVSHKSAKITAYEKLKSVVDNLSEKDQSLVLPKVLVGDIYEDIAKASEVLSASLIVMGTHGAKGMQKLFGSHALKLVSSTSTPFIIIQGLQHYKSLKTIVMPFNFDKESIQIASFAGFIAKKFNATIHLAGYHDEDEWLESKMKSNQQVVRRLFEENDVKYEIVNLPKTKSFAQDFIKYALEAKADLLAASYFTDNIISVNNAFIQELIEHPIPLLTVNAEDLTVTSGYSFMTV